MGDRELSSDPALIELRAESLVEFGQMVIVPSNAHAVDAVRCFVEGHITNLAIVGPSGWGKSQLLAAAAASLGKRGRRTHSVIEGGIELSRQLKSIDPQDPIIIDNFQELVKGHKQRIKMHMMLERRIRSRKPTLLALTTARGACPKGFLPNQHSWNLAEVKVPNSSDRRLIIRKMAGWHGLQLGEEMVALLDQRLSGNARSLEGAMKRLQLAGSRFVEPQDVLMGCGVLCPLLEDDGRWDLRSYLQESICRLPEAMDQRAMTIHVMRNVAHLQEADIATFLEMTPVSVHRTARRFGELIKSDSKTYALQERCVRFAVEKLGTG